MMIVRRSETEPRKRFSFKPLIVLSVVAIGVAAGVAGYRHYNLSTGPKPSDMVTDGFYYGSIGDGIKQIILIGFDADERSYEIDIDTVLGTWSGIVQYKEGDAVVGEGIDGTFTDEELVTIVGTINRLDGKSTIQIDSNKEKTALVREAALPDEVKPEFEDLIGYFGQSQLSLDEYMVQ